MAWTKARRCDSAWLVGAGGGGVGRCQVTLGDWGVSGAQRVLGRGLACQTEGLGLFGVPAELAGPQHCLGSAVRQREERGAHRGRQFSVGVRPRGNQVGFLSWSLSSGSVSARGPAGCYASAGALAPGSPVLPRAPLL